MFQKDPTVNMKFSSKMLVSGQFFPAIVELGCRDWTDDRRHTECRITLKCASGEIECTDWNFFESFKRVREQLALRELYPICYGASCNVVITGMAADMGLGMKVYKVDINSTFSNPDQLKLVHIFATGEDVNPVSVEVQEKFQREWVESRTRK
jgi:hypothetical protein